MMKNHLFDYHLAQSEGDCNAILRIIGNNLLGMDKAVATDWQSELSRFLPTDADLANLPVWSWLLQLKFKLTKPFTSKSEREFHPYEERIVKKKPVKKDWFEIQNPIVLDHLTGLPMVKPTTWKGHLRFAAQMSALDNRVIGRLFGVSSGQEDGQSGRLHFSPTFFTDEAATTTKEVLTPLSRDTRTPVQGRGPIGIEVISPGSIGTFNLLYVPHPKGHDWSPDQVTADLEAAAKAVMVMLLEYGFSAKKTAGWGIVADKLEEGNFYLRPPIKQGPLEEPDKDYFKYMTEDGTVRNEYIQDGKMLSKTQYKKRREGDTAGFEAFKGWYDKYGYQWATHRNGKTPAPSAPVGRPYTLDFIHDLEGLADVLKK